MKDLKVLLAAVLALALTAGLAAAGPCATGGDGLGYQVNGDMVLAPDADGDGIPNCEDPDYTPPADGTGSQFGKKTAPTGVLGTLWLGGLGPYLYRFQQIVGVALGSGYGPGDGTGTGDGPGDGTGYGPGPYGDGDCDGDCDGEGGGLWQWRHGR